MDPSDLNSIWLPYCQMKTMQPPVEAVRTEGVRIVLADGRELIDGVASWWTACHGYNHQEIQQAIVEQAHSMPHVMLGGMVHQPALCLAQRLIQLTGQTDGKVFFTDSGSVAVEVAMKMAVQFWKNQQVANRNKFLCFENSYHGDTVGAMSVCDPIDSMHSHFKGYLLEQYCHPIPETEDELTQFANFVDQHIEQLAGVILEPLVQMAGGMRFHSPGALKNVANICKEKGLLFIADEIATGFGRTGSLFAFQQAGIQPDILCVGKALTGGTISLAATIASEAVYKPFHSDDWMHALMHGPTYMGNALACAAANASLDLFESFDIADRASAIERMMTSRLEQLNSNNQVLDIRCRGAIGVVQLVKPVDAQDAIKFFVEQGVWIRPLRDVIYLTPSLTISDDDLDKLCTAIIGYVGQLPG